MVNKLKLKNFAIFKHNEFGFSSNINILIGKNSTGKSILMKAIYSVIETLTVYGNENNKDTIAYEISKKLREVFLVDKIGKLTTRIRGHSKTEVELEFLEDSEESFIKFGFSTRSKNVEIKDIKRKKLKNAVFIPTKEIISVMDRGFIGLYEKHKFMEGIYYDLAKKLDKPIQLGPHDKKTRKLLQKLDLPYLTNIYRKDNEFFTYIKGIGNLESKLVAEGLRKLMMLVYLIKNGELTNGAYLFWDEPEVNLNPALSRAVVELLIFLATELDIQVFIATHDYFIIKYFDLIKHKRSKTKTPIDIKFFSLYLENSDLQVETSEDLYNLANNAIISEFEEIYNAEVEIYSQK